MRAALGLWRGAALTGLAGPVIEAAAAELDEQRLAALEECFDLELRHGRHDLLVGELRGLVVAHPLRERMVGQLMLALYQSGRRAEALAAYQRVRTSLADELGLDPGARVQQLHAAILGGDAIVDPDHSAVASLRAPAQLPHDIVTFSGRTRHLKRLHELLPTGLPPTGLSPAELPSVGAEPVAAAGSRRAMPVVTITGMTGVGKTALAVHWSHAVAGHFPDGQLYVDLRGFDPTGAAVEAVEAIRGFLDAYGVPADRIPAAPAAQVALYRSVLAGRRVLVVLDNARDAEHVRPLLPGAASCLAVVTSRDQLAGLVTGGAAPVQFPCGFAGGGRSERAREEA